MSTQTISDNRVVADVKCYHCGHVSGQVFGRKHQPLRASNFVPRAGYSGPEMQLGTKLRCERCSGPVFLEDVTSGLALARRIPMKSGPKQSKPNAA